MLEATSPGPVCYTIASLRSFYLFARGLLAAGLAFGWALGTAAQETPAAAFSESTEVNVVNIEVRVFDKKGRPVTGLTAADFEINEDGRRMEISNFYEANGLAPARVALERGVEGDGGAELPRLSEASDRLSLVVYVDNDAVRPAGRDRLLADLRTYLANGKVPVADTTIVARLGGSVRTVMPFGSDSAAVEPAITEVGKMVARGYEVDRLRRATFDELRDIFDNPARFVGDPCTDGATQLESIARNYAAQMADHLGRAVGGLRYLSTVLAAVPGRKAVLYVGDGLEQLPGLSMFHYLAELCPQSAPLFQQNFFVYDETDTLRQLTDHANANRVSIYTLDAAGLRTDTIASVQFGDRRFTPSSIIDRIDTGNLQSSLFVLADETGGRAVVNTNRFLDQLLAIEADLGTYYSVGYTPPHAGDGRRHVISVRLVKNRPWRVRHRRGYVDKPDDTQLAERTFGALLFGFEDNPLGVGVEVLEPSMAEVAAVEEDATVVLRIALPRGRLTFLPGDGGSHVGRVRLVLAVDDGGREALPLKQKLVEVTLSAGDDLQAAQIVDIGLNLPPGSVTLAIGVRDEIGGQRTFLRHQVEVPERAAPSATR